MVILAVSWKANSGKEAEVERLFQVLQAESRKEPGCLLYVVQRHREDRGRFFVYEQYKDYPALEAHRGTAHFQRYAKNELPQVAERLSADLYDPI